MSVFHKTRIVYMGTPEFAVAPLDSLIATGHKVVGVVTAVSKPVGRGMKMSESAVAAYAREHSIPCLQPEKLKDPAFIEALKALKPDLIVVVAFRMLPKVVWEIPQLGTFNLHAALLPQYRGAAPINWAVINGENMTGVTSFMIDEGIDTGKIMMREQYKIKPEDTAGDVHDALMAIGSQVVVQTVDSIIEKHVELRLQKTYIQGSEVLHPAPKLTKELCHIDWRDTAVQIHNLIRGLSPYPGAYTEIVPSDDPAAVPVQLKIFKSHVFEGPVPEGTAPGTILSDGKSYLAVAALDGAVCIDELQLSGKKRMNAGAFLLGFRNPGSYSTTVGTSAEIIKANC
ncbi:MAG: methionyl-tRNA formyltransferase [Bacteroidales bacterium]|nr:methionyl-tRNA formyltransferase [Bacteroidales bacterium]